MARRTMVAGGLAAALVGAGVMVGSTATAGVSICDKYGSMRTVGGYVAQNNLWGADTPQCISVEGDGLEVTRSEANKPTNGAPASYPSLFWGCHYGTCTNGFLPIQASSPRFAALSTSVEFGYVEQGVYDAAYDIWFDPTPRTTGQVTGVEVMIWLKHRGGVQPVGSKVGTVRLAGADWDVWFGNIGWNVVSYVRTTPSTGLSTPVRTFYADTVQRGYAQNSWYLTSVQAGFEPWVGGEGLRVSSFAVTEGGTPAGTPTGTATSRPTSTATPTATRTPTSMPTSTPTSTTPGTPTSTATGTVVPAGARGCRITTRRDQWPGGFVRYVTLTNTGTAPVQGWTLSFTLADGQQLTNGWSATWRQDGRRVSAAGLDWNARLAPGASVDVGFQGTWTASDAAPDAWEVDGVRCAAG